MGRKYIDFQFSSPLGLKLSQWGQETEPFLPTNLDLANMLGNIYLAYFHFSDFLVFKDLASQVRLGPGPWAGPRVGKGP